MTNLAHAPADQLALRMRGVAVPSQHDASACVATEVNWSVARGDFWVVAGPQRGGKTDFLMMAAGLSAPLHGEYDALNEPMPVFEDARLPERLRLGLVFEGGKLFQHLTLAENVALPLRYHEDLSFADAWPRVGPMLEWLELDAFAEKYPVALARDMQARAGLARALMLRPELLFLDNPLARLNAQGAAWWREFLGVLNLGHETTGGRPVTLVVTAENFGPWRKHARQFACLRAGHFTVIGEGAALERCADAAIRELL